MPIRISNLHLVAAICLVGPQVLYADESRTVIETERRAESLRQYIYALDGEIDSLVEEMVKLVPRAEADSRRRDLYDWRIRRSRDCQAKTEPVADPLAELECESAEAEMYYDARRSEHDKLPGAEVDHGVYP